MQAGYRVLQAAPVAVDWRSLPCTSRMPSSSTCDSLTCRVARSFDRSASGRPFRSWQWRQAPWTTTASGATHYLSCLLLEMDGTRPFFLRSTVRDENDQLAVALTNPDFVDDGCVRLALGTLHLSLRKFLWQGALYQRLRIKNHGLQPVEWRLRAERAGLTREGDRLVRI